MVKVLFLFCRKDPCFRTLEGLLSEALPVLVHKPSLLVLAANFCTLGLMIGRLKTTSAGECVQKDNEQLKSESTQ